MKKMLGVIIVLLVIIIVILSVLFYTYVKNNEKDKIVEKPEIIYGPDSEYNPRFWGYNLEEINQLIEQYYGNYRGIYNINAYCYYGQDDILRATVATEKEIVDEYTFDEETGDAVNVATGEIVYFFGTETYIQSIKTKVDFLDNECIAIGYVTDLNEEKFIDKYFNDGDYGQIPYYDFRSPVYQNTSGYGNKFVIIPKNGDVEITVYDCYLDEDGNLYTDNTLIQSIAEPFILLDDYIEYVPKMCIKFQYNGFEEMFPITFSGEDGTLDLSGYEMEVKDISLY